MDMDKKNLKEKCVNLYLDGKTYTEIAKLTNWSRKFITDLIKNDSRVIVKNNTKKIKVCKRKDNRQMIIYIPTEYIEKIGISKNKENAEYVDITIDRNNESIIIKKHSD